MPYFVISLHLRLAPLAALYDRSGDGLVSIESTRGDNRWVYLRQHDVKVQLCSRLMSNTTTRVNSGCQPALPAQATANEDCDAALKLQCSASHRMMSLPFPRQLSKNRKNSIKLRDVVTNNAIITRYSRRFHFAYSTIHLRKCSDDWYFLL